MVKKDRGIHAVKNVKNEVPYYTFPLLEKFSVRHGFSTRLGGVSKGVCSSMNLSFQRGDDPADVEENHRRFAEAVGYDIKNLVFSQQVHGTKVRVVDSSDCGKGIFRESDFSEVDGLVTQDPGVVLMTFFADCVPLFFYDRENHAVGAVHSGWRGTVEGIGARAVDVMHRAFGTEPEKLIAVVGPSICQDCYEVSEEVIVRFQEAFPREEWDGIFTQRLNQREAGKYQLDLWRANEVVLQRAGIPKEQIQVCGLCTCCQPDVFFSHRATQGRRGNLAGVISL